MQTQTLTNFKCCEGLSEQTLAKIAELATEKKLSAGTRVIQEGNPANEFYLIKNGKINVLSEKWRDYDDAEETDLVPVQTLQAGNVLGWSWLVPPYEWGFNADVLEDADVIVVDGEKLRNYAKTDCKIELELYKNFFQVVKQRLLATRMNMALYGGSPFTQCEGG